MIFIKGQNKSNLVNLNRISNICIQGSNIWAWLSGEESEIILGEYNSKKRCLEILDEIIDFISDCNPECSKVYTMPEEKR